MPAKPEAYVAIEAAASPAFSRDGGTLFHLRGSSLPQIWALDLATGQDRALTDHDEKIAFIRRAPGDDRLVYGIDAGGDERQQLWLYDHHTARPLTADPGVIHDFGAWSPDGTHIAYAANDRDEAHFDVMVRPLAGEGAAQRFHEGTNQLAVAGYSPDGRRLAVVLDHAFEQQSLLLLDVIGGARHEIAPPAPTRFASVRWATDGDGLLCLTDSGAREFLALCRLDPHNGAATVVFEAPGRDVEAYAVSPDGAGLATIENDRGYAVLRVGRLGEAPAEIAGLPRGVVADLAWSADSTRLAFVVSGPTTPACLFVFEGGAARAVWCPDPQAEAGIDPANFRDFALVEWPSFDARRIPGWFATPSGAKPSGGWPAVVWVHGGPASQTRANFRADMQMLLAHGYAVLMPNVRGSTGYGRAYTLADEQEQRLDSVRDLAAGAAWLAARPEIDGSRIAVVGQSYGGYMVNAAITEHPELWRAAISYYGIADFTTLLAGTGPWRRAHRAREYGDPDTQMPLFARISPVRNIDRAQAPLLLLHGRRDPRVPFAESELMAAAMRDRQRHVVFESFDYAGHGFIRPDDRRRVYAAVAAFLAEHLAAP